MSQLLAWRLGRPRGQRTADAAFTLEQIAPVLREVANMGPAFSELSAQLDAIESDIREIKAAIAEWRLGQ